MFQQLSGAQERYKLGDLTITDVSYAKAHLADAEAELASAFAEQQNAEANFLDIVGVAPSADMLTPSPLADMPKTAEQALVVSMEHNPQLKQFRLGSKAAKYATYAAKGALLPNASVAAQALRADKQSRRGRYGDSYVKDQERVALSVNIPIFQGGVEYASIRQAQHQERKALMDLDNQQDSLRAQTHGAWENMISADKVLTSRRLSEDAAKVALEGVNEEYKQGTRTLNEVLRTEQDYYGAQLNRATAHYRFISSTYYMHAQMGQINAASLKLPVKVYDPNDHRKKARYKVIGFAQ